MQEENFKSNYFSIVKVYYVIGNMSAVATHYKLSYTKISYIKVNLQNLLIKIKCHN
jgi:hypothetical protein